MSEPQYAFEHAERVGGHPALDFVNTVHRWENGRPGDEYLVDYAALARWHAVTGVLDARAVRALQNGRPAAKREAWREALQLRDALHDVFARVAAGQPPTQPDLDVLQRALERTLRYRRLSACGPGVAIHWHFEGAPPAAILGPVAWSALELLQQGPVDRIKACPAVDGCGWLFLDLSRNRSRTWCSMKTCGNAAKVRRFRARL